MDEDGPGHAAERGLAPDLTADARLEYLPTDTIVRSRSRRSVELTYSIDNPGSGNEEEIDVSISPDTGDPCASMGDALTSCEIDVLDDGELTVYWQEEQPFEDPGILYLVVVRKDHSVTLSYSGVSIERDPREQDFSRFTFDDMVDAVTDPRLGLTTTWTPE